MHEINGIKIKCKRYDELLPIGEIKNYKKNRNKHGQDQVERIQDLCYTV